MQTFEQWCMSNCDLCMFQSSVICICFGLQRRTRSEAVAFSTQSHEVVISENIITWKLDGRSLEQVCVCGNCILFTMKIYVLPFWQAGSWCFRAALSHDLNASSQVSGWHVWWWSWWLSYHLWTFWYRQSLYLCILGGLCDRFMWLTLFYSLCP